MLNAESFSHTSRYRQIFEGLTQFLKLGPGVPLSSRV